MLPQKRSLSPPSSVERITPLYKKRKLTPDKKQSRNMAISLTKFQSEAIKRQLKNNEIIFREHEFSTNNSKNNSEVWKLVFDTYDKNNLEINGFCVCKRCIQLIAVKNGTRGIVKHQRACLEKKDLIEIY